MTVLGSTTLNHLQPTTHQDTTTYHQRAGKRLLGSHEGVAYLGHGDDGRLLTEQGGHGPWTVNDMAE